MRALARRLYDPIYSKWFRADWEGLEKIPTDGGALIVANHAGAIPSDAPVIMHGIEKELERPVYGLADHLFKAHAPGRCVVVTRRRCAWRIPTTPIACSASSSSSSLVFPEGTKGPGKHYSERYRLRRFGRGGFVEIAMRAGVPVVPIAVVGAEESMPIIWKSSTIAKLLGLPYFPITANQLLFGPGGNRSAYFPAKFHLRVLDPVYFDVAPEQAAVLEEPRDGRERTDPRTDPIGALRHASRAAIGVVRLIEMER